MNKIFISILASLLFVACSSDDKAIIDNQPVEGLQFVISAKNQADVGLRAGDPVYSQEAVQSVTRVTIYAFKDDGADYLFSKEYTVSGWTLGTTSKEYTIATADELTAGNYKFLVVGRDATDNYTIATPTSSTNYDNMEASITAAGEEYEIFAGSATECAYYRQNDTINARKTIGNWGKNILKKDVDKYEYKIFFASPYQSIISLCSEYNDNFYVILYAQKWIEAEPDNSNAHESLVKQYYKEDDIINARKAIENWEKILLEKDVNEYEYFELPYQSIVRLCSKYDSIYAMLYSEKWVAAEPNNSYAHKSLAKQYYLQNDTINARKTIENWEKMIVKQDMDEYEYFKLSYQYIVSLCSEYDNMYAMLYSEKWITAEPNNSYAHKSLAEQYYLQNDTINARKTIESWEKMIVKQDMGEYKYNNYLESSYQSIVNLCSKYDDIYTLLYAQRWIEAEPDRKEANEIMADLYSKQKDYDKALIYRKKVIESDTDDFWGYWSLIVEYMNKEDCVCECTYLFGGIYKIEF